MAWLMGPLLLVACVLAACTEGRGSADEADPCVLSIYVYAPEHPQPTRADIGTVDAWSVENEITTLQIWVFTHSDGDGGGDLVGYLSTSEVENLNTLGGETYQMVVDDDFVQNKPAVDVYVVANMATATTGITLGETTTPAELEAAKMEHRDGSSVDPFGLTTLVTSVPTAGLPMSGTLRNQPVYGSAPVLRIGTENQMATARLVRTVSKLRFVASRADQMDGTFQLLDITLDGEKIPLQEFVFLTEDYTQRNYRIGSTYEEDSKVLVNWNSDVRTNEDPIVYAYAQEKDGQEYEQLIDKGVQEEKLTQAGLFYLRETDRKLTGTIRYSVADVEKSATFTMSDDGDFTRNHSWIVYAYYGANNLNVNMVDVMDWRTTEVDHEVYNW